MAFLCRLDEIEDGSARGFTVELDGIQRPIVVARKGKAVFGYRNLCPHAARRLDWVPGEFMSKCRQFLVCSNHDARFRVEDGACVAGPCLGQQLKPVALRVDGDGRVVLPSGT